MNSAPDAAAAECARGVELLNNGQPQAALEAFDRAIALKPDFAVAINNRGNTLKALKRLDAALADFEKAAALMPGRAEIVFNLGNALLELGRNADALAAYNRAVALAPGLAQAFNNRGEALRRLGRLEQAFADFARAASLDPREENALKNCADMLLAFGRYKEAIAVYDKAIALQPDRAEAHFRRGNALFELGLFSEALASYDRAIALDPGFAPAYNNRANTLSRTKRLAEAKENYEMAFRLDPALRFLEGSRLYAKMQLCDWADFAPERERIVARVFGGGPVVWPFTFLAMSDDPAAQLACASSCIAASSLPSKLPAPPRRAHGKIRVAYVSADFHDLHPMPTLMAGVFEAHDRERFETVAISLGAERNDRTQMRLKPAFDRFIHAQALGKDQLAGLLRELETDIAVDLMGFTIGARTELFARKPAPIQVNFLGYPGTMGADFYDYILADRVVVPDGERRFYSEKVVRLPNSYLPTDTRLEIAAVPPSRAELDLPENAFVFCSFNGLHKHTPQFFDVWMRLLRQVEGSVLWLLAGAEAAMHNLRHEAETRGVAGSRLIFAPRFIPAMHLARQTRADLFLDSGPYNAHTTAADALMAGLPVVTLPGRAFASRVGASLLSAAGLPELVTDSLDDYERTALALARDAGRLAALKQKLMRNRTAQPLFDTQRFARNLERAYQTMWERWQRGDAPEHFDVTEAS